MKIGSIKSVCRALRAIALVGFAIVFGLRCYHALLASSEVTAVEAAQLKEVWLPIPLHFSELKNYPYTQTEDESFHEECDACDRLDRIRGSDSGSAPPKHICMSCRPHTRVKLSDVLSKERLGLVHRLRAELCDSNSTTTSIQLHALLCKPLIGADEKFDLYSDPVAMRNELVKEQFFNLLGGLLGIWNFTAFIQNLLVNREKRERKPPAVLRNSSEGWPATGIDVPGETTPHSYTPWMHSWLNTMTRHKKRD
jgi:hypothetical protein